MIFWILIGLLAVAIVYAVIWGLMDDGIGIGFLSGLVAAILGGMVAVGLFFLACLIPGAKVTSHEYELRAIGTDSSISGRFYLGTGYINGHRTLNYIKRVDGWNSIDSAHASASRVFEDSDDPTVTIYTHSYQNGWVHPWNYTTGWTYDFHIPEGSILEDMTITNQ